MAALVGYGIVAMAAPGYGGPSPTYVPAVMVNSRPSVKGSVFKSFRAIQVQLFVNPTMSSVTVRFTRSTTMSSSPAEIPSSSAGISSRRRTQCILGSGNPFAEQLMTSLTAYSLLIGLMTMSYAGAATATSNKKFELMLMIRARAYSSSCSQVILVYLHPFRRNTLLCTQESPKITKNPYHRCWHSSGARRQCLLW